MPTPNRSFQAQIRRRFAGETKLTPVMGDVVDMVKAAEENARQNRQRNAGRGENYS